MSGKSLYLFILTFLLILGSPFSIDATSPSVKGNLLKLKIIVEHDGWRIGDMVVKGHYYKGSPGQWFTGGPLDKVGRVDLEYGKTYAIEGVMGWKLDLFISEKGEVKVKKIEAGKRLADRLHTKLIAGSFYIFLGPIHEVQLDIPWAYYDWIIEDTPEFFSSYWRTGEWTVLLPEGKWNILGRTGWKVSFKVTRRGVKVLSCDSGKYEFKKNEIATQGFKLRLPKPKVYGITFDIPRHLGLWSVADLVNKAGDGFVHLHKGQYEFEGQEIGKIIFAVNARGLEIVQQELVNQAVDVSAQAYRLIINVKPLQILEKKETPPLAVYAFVKDHRKYFRQGETAEFSVVVKNKNTLRDGVLDIELKGADSTLPLAKKNLSDLAPGSHTYNYLLKTKRIKPEDYSLVVSLSGKKQSRVDLVILNPLPETNFKILVYGGYDKSEAVDRFSKGGINLIIHHGLGPNAPRPRLTLEERREYENNSKDPLSPPIEAQISPPWFRSYLESLQSRGIELLAQYSSTFNFFHLGTCFLDPAIYKSVCRGTMAMAQVGREFPNLVAFNLGDESGVHRGYEHPQGCAYCRPLFEKRFGIPTPKSPKDGKRNWIKWMDFKQEMLPTLMRYVGERVKRVANILISAQNGGANYWPQDGGYPPKGMKEFDISAGHHYYAWAYKSVQTLWTVLHDELIETLPKKIPYWPFILPHTGLNGTKHEIYACIMRECEGVGYFTDPEEAFPGQWTGLAKELHPQLHRFGDLFLALDRDRDSEVAVLYSYRQHIMDCYLDRDNWVRPVRRYLDRVAMALYACLRGHIPASFITEEAILNDQLLKRKVLLLVALTEIDSHVLTKIKDFIKQGGVVFVDSETSVKIKGMRRLDFSFGEFYDRWFQVDKFKGEPSPRNDDEVTISLAKRLREVLAPFVRVRAFADSHYLIITEQVHGSGKYFFLLNDRFGGMKKVNGRGMGIFESLPVKVTLTKFDGVIYELFSGRRLKPKMHGENAVLHFYFYPGEMKVLALLPKEIGRLSLSNTVESSSLNLKTIVLDEENRLIAAAFPLEISVLDPKGRIRARVFRAAEKGACLFNLPFGVNDVSGRWELRVKELGSGLEAKTFIELPQMDLEGEGLQLIEELPEVIIYDDKAIKGFLREKRQVTIVIGEYEHFHLALKLQKALEVHQGIQAEIVFDTEIRRNHFPRFYGHGTARSEGSNIAAPDIQIDRDLILIGNPLGNELLADPYFDTELPPRLISPDFPGRGRGTLQYVWQAFSDDDHDAILVSGMDVEGLLLAIEALIDLSKK